MQLHSLVDGLRTKEAAVYAFERGQGVRHSYAALFEDAKRTEAQLHQWGVRPGMRVALHAPNSYSWLVYDLALISLGAISVPFTDDFNGLVDEKLLARYNIALLLTVKSHARNFPDSPPHVVFMDFANDGARIRDIEHASSPDDADLLSLAFSSGSAGGLKGLMISRKGAESTLPPITEAIGATAADRLLLFLPMSNFQQRMMCYAALWKDFDIIITDYTQLFPAMEALHPTILIAPPVLYQMLHAQFAKQPGWKKHLAMMTGAVLSLLPFEAARRALARLLFNSFHKQLGRRMRLMITGMAPIGRNVGQFFRRMQLPLAESYGLVETGSLTYRSPSSRQLGSVGRPVRGVELLLTDDGEIVVQREHPLTLRYFQCAEGENERTFVGVGKIATGDIGKFDSGGNLYLMGRKKELIVTPGGYKIHPEIIEEEINRCSDIAHSVVFLRSSASHLTCVIALNEPGEEAAKARVRKHVAALTTSRKATQFVEVVFSDTPFSKENGMLRPNLKVDRRRVAENYNIQAT